MQLSAGVFLILLVAGTSTSCAQWGGESYYNVSGIVRDELGRPMPELQVHAFVRREIHNNGTSLSGGHLMQETDEQGSFTLQILEGAEAAVFTNTEDTVVDYQVVKGPSDTVELTLASMGKTLSGTVVDSSGAPVPNALLAFSANVRKDFNGANSSSSWRLGLRQAGPLYVTADEQGKYHVNNLPALPIIVWAVPSGDKKALQEQYQYSAKKPVVDLGQGDILDFQVALDPPPKYAPRVQENNERISKILLNAQSKDDADTTSTHAE